MLGECKIARARERCLKAVLMWARERAHGNVAWPKNAGRRVVLRGRARVVEGHAGGRPGAREA
eukprot:3029551-Lingulodinium_polyedra.AAC.1